MITSAVRGATDHEIAVAMAFRDCSGFRVFASGGNDPGSIRQGGPINTAADANREGLRNVEDGVVGFVDELDLKNQSVLGIEAEDLGQDDMEPLVESLCE